MEMLMSLLGGGLGGGLLGGIGTITQAVLNHKDKKNERKHQLKMMDSERESYEQMAKLQMEQVKVKSEAAMAEKTLEDISSARDNDAAKYLTAVSGITGIDAAVKNTIARRMAMVDMLRGLVRPLITYGSVFAVITFAALPYFGIDITTENEFSQDNMEILIGILNNIALAAVTFWFGAKIIQK